MFYHRENEEKAINAILSKPKGSIMIYGKRRVGKTELIMHCIENKKAIYFECMKDTLEANVSLFVYEMKRQGIPIPSYVVLDDFIKIFDYLNELGDSYVIAIDEYPYLYEFNQPKTIDSLFQNIIDHHLSNLNLILAGSEMGAMKELLQEGNPLSGRFSLTIHLMEFTYLEASAFYPNKDVYDKVAFYGVFGGSPFVNKSIRPERSLKENIIATFLQEGSEVFNYAQSTLISDIASQLQIRRILSTIGNGKRKYSELADNLDKNKTGVIIRSLNSLVDSGLLQKVFPINKPTDPKKAHYEIDDNPLRFFYTYVYQRKTQLSILGPERFYEEFIEPTLVHYISFRFERICRDYFSLLAKQGFLKGCMNIGMYYYDDPEKKTNGEFDVAIQYENGYGIYEAKYYQKPIPTSLVKQEIDKIENIPDLNIKEAGIISVNGFEEKPAQYLAIDGQALYMGQ